MLKFECAGCGALLAPADAAALPFACPNARRDDDIDHVVRRVGPAGSVFPAGKAANPFIRYRALLVSHALALDCGLGDDGFVDLLRDLDAAVACVDGRGFSVTPFGPAVALGARIGLAPGQIWVKDETGNVSGSHKSRHLMGVMLGLVVHARCARERRNDAAVGHAEAGIARLAIASCGNAALAAGVIARAAGWPLDVYVPPSAAASVLARLDHLSAAIHTCGRVEGVTGDPCYAAFRTAVADGAIPFCCQGPDNGLTIDGGRTLPWEMISALSQSVAGAGGRNEIDAIFVQVGGGALASAVIQGLADAMACGAIDRLPRVYTVQTTGAYPLKRAYDTLAERILRRVPAIADQGFLPASDRERADLIVSQPGLVDDELRFARHHRSAFMRPWDAMPHSIAHGILDDETYDWAVVVEGMLKTGGWPLVVGERLLLEANTIACETTNANVDHTGSAGLAGVMKAIALDSRLASERIAVIFSGVSRRA
jgi:threonine synthase